jgi:hypothetical protein
MVDRSSAHPRAFGVQSAGRRSGPGKHDALADAITRLANEDTNAFLDDADGAPSCLYPMDAILVAEDQGGNAYPAKDNHVRFIPSALAIGSRAIRFATRHAERRHYPAPTVATWPICSASRPIRLGTWAHCYGTAPGRLITLPCTKEVRTPIWLPPIKGETGSFPARRCVYGW